MKNSIKYILEKRNMQQKELNFGKYKKQYVSKVIHRHFAIRPELITKWESILQVPSRFFVDSNGLCKELNSIDIQELDSFINTQFFIDREKELQQFSECELALREHSLSLNITKLQRNIRKDILTVNGDVDCVSSALDIQENNLWFYKDILELHKYGYLSHDEWKSFFKAFQYVLDGTEDHLVAKDNALVYGMFVLLKRARELNAIKQQKYLREYEEMFGPMLENLNSYDE